MEMKHIMIYSRKPASAIQIEAGAHHCTIQNCIFHTMTNQVRRRRKRAKKQYVSIYQNTCFRDCF